MEQVHEVVIVGGGIAGLATAVGLKRVGIPSLVLERAESLRTTGAAISFFHNAWRALDALGLAHKLTPLYQPFKKSVVTNLVSGEEREFSFEGTKRDKMAVRTIHRKALLQALAEELPSAAIRFSSRLASIKIRVLEDSSTATVLQLEDGTIIETKVLIGCDGVHSVVAKWLGLTHPIDSGRSAVRGLSVFPQGHGFKHEVRQILKHGIRVGFAPVNDTDIYWFTTHNTTEKDKEMAVGDPRVIQREVLETLLKDFPEDLLHVVRNADLPTVSWAPLVLRPPWQLIIGPGSAHKDSVTVAGDAFHPMTPDLAQGGGSALEDAVVLVRHIAGALNMDGKIDAKRVEKEIEEYVNERKWRVSGLVLGAYLSGWVQQGGSGFLSGWFAKLFRDHVFYRFIQPRLADAIQYDCGDLPSP